MTWRDQTQVSPRVAFLAGLALCWASAGLMPYTEAAQHLLLPNDFTPDYVVAATWIHEGKCGRPWPKVLDRETANQHALSMGAPDIPLFGPYYTHPPPALAPILPLVPLGYTGAVVAWLLISAELLGILAWIVAPLFADAGARIRAWQLFVLLFFWPPVLSCLEQGQWTIALAATMALGHRAWEQRRHRQGAGWMAVATALKLSPAVVIPGLALRDRRAVVWFGGLLLAIVVACLPFGGVSAWIALFREAGPNTVAWQTFWHNTTSINGLAARLFLGGMMSKPLVVWPLAARVLRLLAGGALVGIASWASWRTRERALDRNQEGCVLALWYLLPAMLNPLGWAHYALLFVLPAALAARAAAANGDRRARNLVMVGLALASVPKEALYLMAGPFPVPAPRCAVLSMHLYAGLLLFAAAAAGAVTRIDKPAALK